ncbi:MAG: TIGR04282 family arsenosugar biosynthesis glycosyltransferase [Pseudomonadota bacterium]
MAADPRITCCLFAKPPVAGQVKTRLAAPLGDDAAVTLAQAFLDDSWAALRQLSWVRRVLACTGPVDGVPANLQWEQGEGDLGARIERVLRRALQDADVAIALGADTPGLPVAFLKQCRAEFVAGHDAVLGPSDDGGFYLLALRRCPAGLLADLPWSAPTTAQATQRRLVDNGMRPVLLPPWFDVDELKDLVRLAALIDRGEVQAPATKNALGTLGLGP